MSGESETKQNKKLIVSIKTYEILAELSNHHSCTIPQVVSFLVQQDHKDTLKQIH